MASALAASTESGSLGADLNRRGLWKALAGTLTGHLAKKDEFIGHHPVIRYDQGARGRCTQDDDRQIEVCTASRQHKAACDCWQGRLHHMAPCHTKTRIHPDKATSVLHIATTSTTCNLHVNAATHCAYMMRLMWLADRAVLSCDVACWAHDHAGLWSVPFFLLPVSLFPLPASSCAGCLLLSPIYDVLCYKVAPC